MYDEIVCAVWGIASVPALNTQEAGTSGLYKFQELIQSLVSLDDLTDQVLSKSNSSGAPLLLVQRQMKTRMQTMESSDHFSKDFLSPEGSFQNIDSILRTITRETDSSYDEEREFAEFIHLDALEAVPEDPTTPTPMHPGPPSSHWKDVHPIIVLLLASVAFSIVLTAVSGKEVGLMFFE